MRHSKNHPRRKRPKRRTIQIPRNLQRLPSYSEPSLGGQNVSNPVEPWCKTLDKGNEAALDDDFVHDDSVGTLLDKKTMSVDMLRVARGRDRVLQCVGVGEGRGPKGLGMAFISQASSRCSY